MAQEPDEREPVVPGDSPGGGLPADDRGPAAWMSLVGIGLEFVATICVMAAIGWYLDRRWHTSPWLMVAGCVVGFAGGLVVMIRSGIRAFKD